VGASVKECDFIPASYLEARKTRQAVKTRSACVGLLIIFMVIWVVVHQHRLASAQAMIPELARQQDQIAVHMAKKASMESERARLREHRELLRELEERVSPVVLFSDVSRRMPSTVVLVELSLECPSIARFSVLEEPAPEVEPPSSARRQSPEKPEAPVDEPSKPRLSIRGIATAGPEVVGFAAAIESSPLFDRVQMEMKGPTIWGGRHAQEFVLTCDVLEQEGSRP